MDRAEFGKDVDCADCSPAATGAPGHGVTLASACRVWAGIGLNSFGGPAGQIAVMHKTLVERHRWISEERFLHALNYCMLLPGPEAMQLATYVGWLMHRTAGGLLAGALFVLPGFAAILALSVMYTLLHDIAVVQSLLFGLKAAVLAIVVEAVLRIGRRVLHNGLMYAVAAASFAAIFVFEAPFPAIIVAAGMLGLIGHRVLPERFEVLQFRKAASEGETPAHATDAIAPWHTAPSVARTVWTAAVWLVIWLGPVVALRAWLGADNIYVEQAWFFSKAAVVTFGGAYAVLAYMAQQAVEVYGWLAPGEMLTGLGMAETTPGPLIQVVQFVGYMGAYRAPGPLSPIAAGVLASVLTTWVTFAPCFLWIFAGAPYMERIRGARGLTAALSTITAAVVGVVLNLAVWFALHTLFGELHEIELAVGSVSAPVLGSVSWPALFISVIAAGLIFFFHWRVPWVLLACVAVSVALGVLGFGG